MIINQLFLRHTGIRVGENITLTNCRNYTNVVDVETL